MIAWTSPGPTSRSMPCRISRSGAAIGRDAQAADDEAVRGVGGRAVGRAPWWCRWSVGHDGVKAPSRAGGSVVRGWRATVRERHEVGEGHAVERAGDGVADADPEQVHGARRRSDRRPGRGRLVLGRADHRRERALEGAQDLAHRDRLRRARELVAAVGAARGDDEAGVAKHERELLEVCPRHVLGRGDLRERRGPCAEMPPELDHQPNAVLALRAERDGARAVERGPMRPVVGFGGVVERQEYDPQSRAILSGLSVRTPFGASNLQGRRRSLARRTDGSASCRGPQGRDDARLTRIAGRSREGRISRRRTPDGRGVGNRVGDRVEGNACAHG